ncbi:MAG TPA: CRISPR-associated helicase Cas3' [Spirochaetota bacterium]|nr:CRISPR-associated helicase Cas3' [Spirochaetota bacterium]
MRLRQSSASQLFFRRLIGLMGCYKTIRIEIANYMIYYAHTIKNKSENEWHKLVSHLKETADLAASFANSDGYASIFRLAGYLHDLGKYQPAFQKYLREGGRRGSVPHASWGAAYSLMLKNQEIAFAIDGHHKGLPDRSDAQMDLAPFRNGDIPELDDVIKAFHKDNFIEENQLQVSMPSLTALNREMFVRYLFSALTDADWLNAEKACNPELSLKREHLTIEYDDLITKIEKYINNRSKEGELNTLRNKAREFALARAHMPTGFYSMNLPTGMGKTLASISWALEHANHNSLKRIIIVLPYINIIDQTAHILKDILGEEYVLEHHSGIGEELSIPEDERNSDYGKRLACENWDCPIIVTTTVQFFESIFSNKPSKCRKIHNIAESVVIFDEVQSLPKEIIIPTLTMLENMLFVMRTSFLFCTATLPAFEKRKSFDGIESITSLVDNPDELFQKTRRVEYLAVNHYEPVDFTEIINLAENQHCSVLSVFNTKKSALEFYKHARGNRSWKKHYHLSTGMCPIHRKRVIKNIRQDLSDKNAIFVSSTQLIEAGVDFDFPCVFREIAPLESIIQAAGRCNREGSLGEYGKVFLFCLSDAGMPDKQYRTATWFALDMIKENPDSLYEHSFFHEYYEKLVGLFIDGDVRKINKSRENFDFKTVSEAFKIIDKATKGLFIYNYDDESRKFIDDIQRKQYLSRDDFRNMQRYTVQVYDNFIFENKDFIVETHHGILIWYGGYDEKYGISVDAVRSDEYVV